ncbi:SHOCT domain-containing protein [uncultured Roseobacter sp.]|uniref:SHOCT domain-containing protein n=1 Tax=uncultured Roseobacter sp. TaxID=114847 RepID=UPI00260F99BF|nr:SHOCT domain-containing protein [uncultured Roseobacter sp.]
MTAILHELRSLDEKLARGDITDVEYMARKARLIDSVDVVEPEVVADAAPREQPEPPEELPGAMTWGFGIVLCLGVLGICLCLAVLVIGDVNLALTLGVTVLAALSVALFRNLEE